MTVDMSPIMEHIAADSKLTKDLRVAAETLGEREARFLVDQYYTLQDYRKATANQIRALGALDEPNETVQYFSAHFARLESEIKRVLDIYTSKQPAGIWMKSITGIGPVIAAGMLAHIDITRAPTYGHIWSFAGLNPEREWLKGQKRPWNAELKTLCWKLGESFVKVQNNDSDYYGKLYAQRKAYEVDRNERGENEPAARAKLERFNIGKDTDAYKAYSRGELPPAHVHARAKRWTVKLFISHLHDVMHYLHYGVRAPMPYALAQLDHAHYIAIPNIGLVEGMASAPRRAVSE